MNKVQCTDQHSSSDSNRRNVNSKSTVRTKVRKYNTEYLQLGFTFARTEDEPKPQCIICLEILSNESMKPSKLRRHFETKHGEFTSKYLDFFVVKLGEFKKSQKVMKSSTSLNGNKNATLASYEVAQLVAKSGKAHTIACSIPYQACSRT
eukprot:XP_016658336.1 PREDICTED: zinc finger BED domain-containing protein 5-like isoform X1 [Acyrthosiphon pisum]